MADWRRPESVPYPSIWRTFERTKDTNGTKQKYWVQDLTPEYEDEFLHAMRTGFLVDEILCIHCNFIDDAQSVDDIEELWKDVLKEKLGLICLTKNSEGQVQIVGGNITARSYKGQPHDISPSRGKEYKQIISILQYVTDVKDVYDELGINAYLTALGLYVFPQYRGEGIGAEILRARQDLCLAVGIKASLTVFSSIISQKTAAKAGFVDLVEVAYEDLQKVSPEYKYVATIQSTKSIKLMYIKYN